MRANYLAHINLASWSKAKVMLTPLLFCILVYEFEAHIKLLLRKS